MQIELGDDKGSADVVAQIFASGGYLETPGVEVEGQFIDRSNHKGKHYYLSARISGFTEVDISEEIVVSVRNLNSTPVNVFKGQSICQMLFMRVVIPAINLVKQQEKPVGDQAKGDDVAVDYDSSQVAVPPLPDKGAEKEKPTTRAPPPYKRNTSKQ